MPQQRVAIWLPVFLWVSFSVAETPELVSTPENQEHTRGVVIEKIAKDSVLKPAGLQVGDVILSWERLASPPANPEDLQGAIVSYFDWQELEVEQAPRGVVRLLGQRDGEPLTLNIQPGLWNAKVRPVLPRPLEEIYASGKARLTDGDLSGAIQTWNSLAEASGDRDDLRAWTSMLVGEVWESNGELTQVTAAYREAIEATQNPKAHIAAWKALGSACRRRNDFEGATAAYEAALKIAQSIYPGGLNVASIFGGLGSTAWVSGDLRSAHKFTLQALSIREKIAPESLSMASSLSNLGSVALAIGELDLSHDYLEKALHIQETISPWSLNVATSLDNLGVVASSRKELERAQAFHIRALKIREQLAPQSLVVAQSLNNLGIYYLARNDLKRAYDHHLRALQIEEQRSPESVAVAVSLSNLGKIERARGNLERAREYHLRSLAILSTLTPQSLEISSVLNGLGSIAGDQGHLDLATDYFRQASEILEQLKPNSLDLAVSLHNLGDIARTRGDLTTAHSYFSRTLDTIEHQLSSLGGSYDVQAGFRSQHRGYYLDFFDLLLNQNRSLDAFQLLERFHAQTFLRMLAERDLAFVSDLPEELDRERRRVGVLYDRTLQTLTGLNLRDHVKEIETIRQELRKLDDEAGDIEARIRRASPKLAALRYSKPLGMATTQQMLDPGTLLLSFSLGKDKTTLFALSHTGALETKILAFGEETLRSRTQQLLTLMPEAKGGSSLSDQRRTQLQAISRELYTELLAPVSDRIAASERLLILPDGPLHALPFAALMRDTENGPQYLGAWKPLHVALSATVFAELKQGRRPSGEQNTVPAPLQLAAFGDPVYPQSLAALKISSTGLPADGDVVRGDPTVRGAAERGLFDFQPLPHSRREVLGIAKLFPEGSARTFLGLEALEERIKSLDPNTRILHLAAHGSVDEHLPSGSFIALTIPEQTASEETEPQRDNGLLQVWEIFERVRLNADLVVLSACDTGLGEELGGEGLIGLTRAFQYAGARTVMASLWSVQDQATSELMIRFYKHLRAGLTKDRALQAAQQELIRGPIEVTDDKGERVVRDFSAPYYWAGFQLYGDWQ